MRFLFVLALLAASVCQAQNSGSVPKPPWARSAADDATDIKVDVKLVNIFVTVTDEHGSPVGSLTKDNFQIFYRTKSLDEYLTFFDKNYQK